MNKLWVGNISSTSSESSLRSLFEKHGKVTNVLYKNKGYAFITYAEDCTHVLERDIYLNEKKLTIRKAQPIGDAPTKSIYVSVPSADITEAVIRTHFEQFGVVRNIKHLNNGGASKQSFFVDFENESDATDAHDKLEQTINGELLYIDYNRPTKRKRGADAEKRRTTLSVYEEGYRGGYRFGKQEYANMNLFKSVSRVNQPYEDGYDDGYRDGYFNKARRF